VGRGIGGEYAQSPDAFRHAAYPKFEGISRGVGGYTVKGVRVQVAV
jgi:hypothetical protein